MQTADADHTFGHAVVMLRSGGSFRDRRRAILGASRFCRGRVFSVARSAATPDVMKKRPRRFSLIGVGM
jgi:hypothetical protein